MSPRQAVQIGPSFTLTVYMLFAGHDRPQTEDDFRETTWKEVIHKAKVKLRRVPLDVVAGTGSGSDAIPSTEIVSHSSEPSQADIPAEARSDEFAYQLMIVEDFDDDRMHDFEEDQAQPGPFDDVNLAGIREMVLSTKSPRSSTQTPAKSSTSAETPKATTQSSCLNETSTPSSPAPWQSEPSQTPPTTPPKKHPTRKQPCRL